MIALEHEAVDYGRREMRRRKEEANTQFFDDLLLRLDEALRGDGAETLARRIRDRYRVALIDEFQDTDPIQYRIFRRIYAAPDAGGALFLIGDPKQAIYAFRGADVFAYIEAKGAAGDQAYELNVNRRSDPSLIEGVSAVFGRAREPFVFADIPFLPVLPAPESSDRLGDFPGSGAPLQILFVARGEGDKWVSKREAELPRRVAAEIDRLLSSRATIGGERILPSDVAILCRTNAEAQSMQAALRELRIACVLQGDSSVFESVEAAELERVLRAMASPGEARALKAALATPIFGLDAAQLYELQDDEGEWDKWVRHFQAWHETWVAHGFIPSFRQMLGEGQAHERLLSLVDGERRLTNFLHLGELLQAEAVESRRGPLALVEWLAQMRADEEARRGAVGEAAQIRLESDAEALKLLTVHKSKGLQYPIVYCPYLWGKSFLHDTDKRFLRFHDPADGNRLKLDLGSDDLEAHLALAEREALAENLRLLYVAMTRAKHRCSVVWGRFHQAETSALAYLLHQPEQPAGDLRQEVIARLQRMSDDEMRADLRRLEIAAPGAIGVDDLTSAAVPAAPGSAAVPAAPVLSARTSQRTLQSLWRTSSFTGLVAGGGRISRPAEEGIDRDEVAIEPASGEAPPLPAASLVRLHDFPSGARSGQLIHDLLEHLDFADSGAPHPEQVAEVLLRHGLDPSWEPALRLALGEVLDTPLRGAGEPFSLRQIPAARRRAEMEFIFPVAGTGRQPLTSPGLAEVMARYGAATMPPGYAGRLAALRFKELEGYLRGFIDLVFESGGRWYVVDYKSNHLGPRPADYRAARLPQVMADHHYILQYHLYAVALHRYLGLRLAGYDYESHFGGVYYLFLRGMSPEYPRHNGVFWDRPGGALIEALSQLLAGAADGGRMR